MTSRFVGALATLAVSVVCFAQDPATAPALGYRDTFQTNYTNAFIPSLPLINVTNPGFHGLPGPGDICVNVYTYRPDQTFISCCSCRLSPNGLLPFTGNNLYPGIAGSVAASGSVIKLVATLPKNFTAPCDPAAYSNGLGIRGGYASGMRAWANHALNLTEAHFEQVPLGSDESNKIIGQCANLPVANRCVCPAGPA